MHKIYMDLIIQNDHILCMHNHNMITYGCISVIGSVQECKHFCDDINGFVNLFSRCLCWTREHEICQGIKKMECDKMDMKAIL